MSLYLGIDPGKSGATAFLTDEGDLWTVKHSETYHDLSEAIRDAITGKEKVFAVIEKVHAMPGQGVTSMFTFGQSFGFSLGLLTALRVPYEMVTPATWQKVLGCRSKGNKNVTKSKAQELFPNEKIIHATADAILIAEYARRMRG